MGLVALTFAVGAVLGLYTRAVHLSFAFSAYDAAIHLQALWKLAHGDGLFNTVRGMSYWGDHLWIAYALLAPLYRLWPSFTLAYLYQGIGLAAGGLAVYGIARRRLRRPLLALVPVLLYWCYPGLIYTAQENFHPEAIASTWLLLLLWADETERPRMYWLAAALALLTKEDMAVYVMAIAAYTVLCGRWRRGLLLGAVSAAYLLVALKGLLPYFNQVGFFRTGGGYWFHEWSAHALDPAFYLERLFRPEVRTYVWDLFWPLAFLPLLHPMALVVLAGPAFLVNVAGGAYLVSVHYHYLYGILPGLFFASVLALATLERLGDRLPRRGPALAALVLAGTALYPTLRAQVTGRGTGDSYVGMVRRIALGERDRGPKIALLNKLIAHLPTRRVVSASHNLVPFLANRDQIYMFPNPWRPYYWGIRGEHPADPAAVETIFLDTDAIGDDLVALARATIASGGWYVAVDQDDVLLAHRLPAAEPLPGRAPAGP